MNVPTYSVIIPTLNEEKFIGNLLSSLSEQSEKDFEVIVVDGSSKDKTVEIVKSFTNKIPSLRIVKTKASLPLQRNAGARQAKGAWLVFIDADSVLLPYCMERMTHYVQAVSPDVFTPWYRPDRDDSGSALLVLLGNLMTEMAIRLKKPLTPGPFTAIKKSIFNTLGGYDEGHAFHEDMDLGLRLQKNGYPLKTLKETLYLLSLRRLRNQGTFKVAQQYILAALPVLLFNRTLTYMPGYIMGGASYGQVKKPQGSFIKIYRKKIKKLVDELTG